ncbi:MAG: diacylglycerol kinase [Gammaproteobacteria bacterium]|nr:diacylglycerol kinase [Gammaproteobacteria bacterium]
MGKPGKTGFSRIWDAFFYSMKGFASAWRHEAAFRQEMMLAVVLIPLAFWLAETHIELILLISSVLLVLLAELINSSVEAVVDRTGTEHHELSGRAKDIGSAVVFLSFVMLGVVWGIIAYNRFVI